MRPVSPSPLDNLVVSPLDVILKKEPNKFCLIHLLSFPKGGSVNDAIDPRACAVSYTSFDATVYWVCTTAKGPLWQKTILSRLIGCYRFTRAAFICWAADGWGPFTWIAACSVSCAFFETFSFSLMGSAGRGWCQFNDSLPGCLLMCWPSIL